MTAKNHNKKYCKKYDAYYWRRSNVWAESTCRDSECEYCSGRPAFHPSDCDECSTPNTDETAKEN